MRNLILHRRQSAPTPKPPLTPAEKKLRRHRLFNQIVLIFIIGCIFGTYWEELLYIFKHLLESGALEWSSRRGLLYGPFSPIYGIAAVLIYLIFYRTKLSIPACFIWGALFGGALEFLLSVLQEWIFGTTSWDYSQLPFNIAGRTTIPYMIVWGVLIVLFVHLVFPVFNKFYDNFTTRNMNIACIIMAILMLLDIGISVAAVWRQASRHNGEAADTRLEVFLDTHYDDERMEETYSNTHFVQK